MQRDASISAGSTTCLRAASTCRRRLPAGGRSRSVRAGLIASLSACCLRPETIMNSPTPMSLASSMAIYAACASTGRQRNSPIRVRAISDRADPRGAGRLLRGELLAAAAVLARDGPGAFERAVVVDVVHGDAHVVA